MRNSIGIGLGLGLTSTRRPWLPSALGSSLQLWVRADLGVTTASGRVVSWHDQSGKGRDFSQGTFSKQPVISSGYLGGKDAVYFDGTTRIVAGNWSLSSITGSADVFVVMKTEQDPSTALKGNGGCFQIAGAEGDESLIPYTNGVTYCSCFSSARYTVGNIGAGHYLSKRIVEIRSSASSWSFLTDGVQRYNSPTNTFYSGAGGLLSTALGGDPERADIRMYGGISEVIVVSPSLTAGQRVGVYKYLGSRYGITTP